MVRDHRPDLSLTGPVIFTEPTVHGGPSSNCKGALLKPIGCGTVFELIPTAGGAWQEQMLHSFAGADQRWRHPAGNLIMDANGNLYGTTAEGGIKSTGCEGGQGPAGCGTIFELSSATATGPKQLFTNLPIANGDGSYPEAGLVEDPVGNFLRHHPARRHFQRRLRHSVQAGSRHRRRLDGERFSTALPAPAETAGGHIAT